MERLQRCETLLAQLDDQCQLLAAGSTDASEAVKQLAERFETMNARSSSHEREPSQVASIAVDGSEVENALVFEMLRPTRRPPTPEQIVYI